MKPQRTLLACALLVVASCSAAEPTAPSTTAAEVVIPITIDAADDVDTLKELYRAYPVNRISDEAALHAAEVWTEKVSGLHISDADRFLFYARTGCVIADEDGGSFDEYVDALTDWTEDDADDVVGELGADGIAAFFAAVFAASQQICPQHFSEAQAWIETAELMLYDVQGQRSNEVEALGDPNPGDGACPSWSAYEVEFSDVVEAGIACAANEGTLGEPFNEAVYCGGYAQAAAYEGWFPDIDRQSLNDSEYRAAVNAATFREVVDGGQCVATNGSAFATFPEAWCSGFEKAAFDIGTSAGMPVVKEYFVDWESQVGGEGHQRCVEESWWQYPNIVDHVLENG